MKHKAYERYYIKNREKILAKMKKYNKANREKLNEYMKEYRKNNKDKLKIYYSNYLKKNDIPLISKTRMELHYQKKKILKEYGNRCIYCGLDNNSRTAFGVLFLHKKSDGFRDIYIIQSEKSKDINFYNEIERMNYPDDYELVCFNCYISKLLYGFNGNDKDFESKFKKYFEGEDTKQ